MYGKVMSIPDDVMPTYYRLLTPHHADELARIEQDFESGAVNPRDLKARLAREIITRLRGAAAAAAAEEHFDSVFRRHESAADLQELALEPADVEEDGKVFLPAVLERWFGQTRSEWRRRIQQGGVSLDGEPVSDLAVPTAALAGTHVKAGKSAKTQGVVRSF
jgi:tyrosyl-tRNA synthetase